MHTGDRQILTTELIAGHGCKPKERPGVPGRAQMQASAGSNPPVSASLYACIAA